MKYVKLILCSAGFLLIGGCQFFQEKTLVSSKNNVVNAAATPTPMPAPSVIAETPNEKNNSPAEALKPENEFVLAETTGDLNGDGRDDLAAVYSRDNPETEKAKVGETEGEAARLFVVALQNAAGQYERIFSGSKIILCRNCSGMNDNVVPDLKIADRKIHIDQNVLATSEVDYHLEIELKNGRELVITKGSIENRVRRSGETETKKIKTPITLGDFDISDY